MSLYSNTILYPLLDIQENSLTETLKFLGFPDAAAAVSKCGTWTFNLECGECGSVFNRLYSCKHRLCSRCQVIARKQKFKQALPFVATFKNPRFMTLTLKNFRELSNADFKRLSRCFHYFKIQVKRMGYKLSKGIACKEITQRVSVETPQGVLVGTLVHYDAHGLVLKVGKSKVFLSPDKVQSVKHLDWHLHLHLLYQGSYIPQRVVRDCWLQATKDSYVVDIKAVRSSAKAFSYINKYFFKGNCVFTPLQIGEYLTASKGVNMVHVLKPRSVKLQKPQYHCPLCGGKFRRVILGEHDLLPPELHLESVVSGSLVVRDVGVSLDELYARVQPLLDQAHNAEAVEGCLTEAELEVLLERGFIAQVRHDMYIGGI